MRVVRQAPARVLLLILVAAVAVAVGARLAFARSMATPIGTGIVVIDTNLAYVNGAAAGTGMVLTSSGEILTNNHVIAGATTIKVVVPNTGRSYTARVLGYSRSADVAVLQLQHASNLKTVSTSGSARLTVGAAVKAVGNAGGSGSLTSAAGTVTGLGRAITASDDQGSSERLTGLIETNAGVEPGDSGGPLLNSSGKVIGMVTAASAGSGFQSVAASDAYAIPIGKALAIARQIVAGNASATVHIGEDRVPRHPVQAVDAGRYGYGYGDSPAPASGALIAGVVTGGPADSAGLGAGDVITKLGGRTVSSPTAVTAFVMTRSPGRRSRSGTSTNPVRATRRASRSAAARRSNVARVQRRDGLTGGCEPLEQARGSKPTGSLLHAGRDCLQAGVQGGVGQEPLDRIEQLVVLERVGREARPEAALVNALSVVVLVPEERQRDHRLAEVEALRRRVVAAVGDDEVDERQQRGLREELGAPHVRREVVLLVLRSLGDDESVRRAGEHLDQATHQLDVGRAQAPEREVDEPPLAGRDPVRELDRAIGAAHAGVEAVPRRAERRRALVVDLGRVEIHVQPGRLVDELALGQAAAPRSTQNALNSACRSRWTRAYSARKSSQPARSSTRVAREDRRESRDPSAPAGCRRRCAPRAARLLDRRERDHVVLDDHVRLELVEDLAQPVVDVARAVAERAECRLDELAELLDGRLAEDRRGLADEVLPELAGRLLDLGRRAEPHQPLLESLRLEAARERLLDHEDDAVPALLQDLADPDAVVRRAEGAFREEDEGLALRTSAPLIQ